MFDCAKDVLSFHDEKVTLPQSDRTAMRDRRNANRDRSRKGLEKNAGPPIDEHVVQGSYAMKTMLRHDANDYDIDDGVYFAKEDLVGPRGAELTSRQAREMVRDAVDDGSFADAPEVHGNCVRVVYKKGYHVDMPVYRKVSDDGAVYYELASASGWKRSDARDVTEWFDDVRSASADGVQLRRIVRLIKKFAKSRDSWSGQLLSGFGITALVAQEFVHYTREDEALYYTMKAIRDRLTWNLVVAHPVTPNDTITDGPEDPKARRLKGKLTEAIDNMAPLFASDCTRNEALGCWDKVFFTTHFSERGEARDVSEKSVASTSAAIIGSQSDGGSGIFSAGGSRHA
ncbi:MAG: hypothetical protein GW854_06680 [Erythrobacter sp.]|nr:hypothetical protein [Erythrobacter sp.]